jgi:hypothetical protein
MNRVYYGYKHWTLEETARCFYVCKGKKKRPYDAAKMRSKKWCAVAERYGLRIEVCVGPFTDQEAIAWEIEYIAKEGTFTTSYSTKGGTDIGCNFTHGGDGASGYVFPKEVRLKLLGQNNPAYGKPAYNRGKKFKASLEAVTKGVAVRKANDNYRCKPTTKVKIKAAWAKVTPEARAIKSAKQKATLDAKRLRGELKKSPEEIAKRLATEFAKPIETRKAENDKRKATRQATLDAKRINGIVPRSAKETAKRKTTNDAKRARGEPIRSACARAKQRSTWAIKRFRKQAHKWFNT